MKLLPILLMMFTLCGLAKNLSYEKVIDHEIGNINNYATGDFLQIDQAVNTTVYDCSEGFNIQKSNYSRYAKDFEESGYCSVTSAYTSITTNSYCSTIKNSKIDVGKAERSDTSQMRMSRTESGFRNTKGSYYTLQRTKPIPKGTTNSTRKVHSHASQVVSNCGRYFNSTYSF